MYEDRVKPKRTAENHKDACRAGMVMEFSQEPKTNGADIRRRRELS